jgi:SAM-dependent methyltransferase
MVAVDHKQLASAFRRMCEKDQTRQELEDAYREFSLMVRESLKDPPQHMRILLEQVREIEEDHPEDEITILDHGCGGGLTLHYLAEAGFRNVYGVDIAGERDINNLILREFVGLEGPRLLRYDGQQLPFESGTVDFVFSQQVLEHVSNVQLETYFAEEARVLKPGGIILHEIPHRLIPYDSHSRTWFLHYLPVPVRNFLYGLLRVSVPNLLFLRWPWCYRRQLRRDFGNCIDTTADRIRQSPDRESYDGPYGLRRLVGSMISMPVMGPLFAPIISNLVMLELRSVRPSFLR